MQLQAVFWLVIASSAVGFFSVSRHSAFGGGRPSPELLQASDELAGSHQHQLTWRGPQTSQAFARTSERSESMAAISSFTATPMSEHHLRPSGMRPSKNMRFIQTSQADLSSHQQENMSTSNIASAFSKFPLSTHECWWEGTPEEEADSALKSNSNHTVCRYTNLLIWKQQVSSYPLRSLYKSLQQMARPRKARKAFIPFTSLHANAT